MDPISLLIGALVLTACAKVGLAATADTVATLRASKAGEWDVIDRQRQRSSWWERLGAAWSERRRQRHEVAGGAKGEDPRPGAKAYAQDLYHGFWEDQLERRRTKRATRGPYVYDPDRPTVAQRFDDAVLAKVARWRQALGRPAPEKFEDAPLDELLTDGSSDDPTPQPVDHEPGIWTVGERGERVELGPMAADPEAPYGGNDTERHGGYNTNPTRTDSYYREDHDQPPCTSQQPSGGTMTGPTPTTTGEAIDVTTAVSTCQHLNLQLAAIRERAAVQAAALVVELEQVARTVETLDASARDLEFDPATLDGMARMFEAINAMTAAVTAAGQSIGANSEAVSASSAIAQREFEKHLPGVEFNAAVGGMAKKSAYQNV